MRAFVWDPIRAGHYGQRPRVPRKKAEHTGAPTNAAAYVKKALANSEPSTHGGKADIGQRLPQCETMAKYCDGIALDRRGILEAAKGFRRLKAYNHLPALRTALGVHQSKCVTKS
jgi:hypothetical protein